MGKAAKLNYVFSSVCIRLILKNKLFAALLLATMTKKYQYKKLFPCKTRVKRFLSVKLIIKYMFTYIRYDFN